MKLSRLLATLGQPIGRLKLDGGPAYAFALGMVLLAAGVRAVLPDGLGTRVPFPTFFLAVFFSAWVGGWRAGLFASVLTVIAGLTLFPVSPPPWDGRDMVALGFVFIVCVAGAYACSRLRVSTDLVDRDRAWYQRILEGVGDAVLVADEAGRVRYFNRHAAALWDIDDSDLGTPIHELARFHLEGTGLPWDGLPGLLHRAGRGRELPNGLEIRKGAHPVPVMGTVSAYLDPEYGRGVVLSVQSILELRDAGRRVELSEKRLVRKERELRLILQSVPARIAYMDRDGRFQWANRNFTEWYGAREPAKGQRLDQFMGEQAMQALGPALDQARCGLVAQVEWLEDNPMMGRRWTTTTLSPDLDDDGDVRGIISLCVDSTQRHETEDALRRSDAEHRTLAENVPHLVWMADAQGHLQYGNSRWTDYTGSNAGGHWTDALHPDEVEGALSAMAEAARLGEQLSLEARIRRAADGAYRWHLVRALPLASPEGDIVRWYGSCTDIDDQKAAQETLHAAHARMTGFLATLSHELRNPLAALAASTPLLAHDQLGDEVRREAARTIDRQTRHLKRLTDDLLDVSRITLGKIQVNRERFDLRETCRDCCADYGAKARGRGVHLACDLPDEPVPVLADPARMRQCIDNLVSNALKASSAGMHVVVKLRRRDDQVELEVSDEGVGIEPESLPTLFHAFSQGEAWRNQGLGLGLNIVNRLVELHGGTVAVESRGRNLGTRFIVRLPGPADAPGPNAGAPTPARPADVDAAEPACGSVLIVDDESDNARALGHVLGLEGHVVHLAEDGIEAITLAGRVRPDVVICDLGLPPPMHGHEVAERLRATFGGDIYLCAYSGYGSRADVSQSLAAGFDEHITKPASPREIASLVQRGLQAMRAGIAEGQP